MSRTRCEPGGNVAPALILDGRFVLHVNDLADLARVAR
jgi:hypothetical protein